MTQLGDAALWSISHIPLTFCLLAVWCGGMALVAHLLGRRIA